MSSDKITQKAKITEVPGILDILGVPPESQKNSEGRFIYAKDAFDKGLVDKQWKELGLEPALAQQAELKMGAVLGDFTNLKAGNKLDFTGKPLYGNDFPAIEEPKRQDLISNTSNLAELTLLLAADNNALQDPQTEKAIKAAESIIKATTEKILEPVAFNIDLQDLQSGFKNALETFHHKELPAYQALDSKYEDRFAEISLAAQKEMPTLFAEMSLQASGDVAQPPAYQFCF